MHACFTSLFISLYPVPLRERKVNAVVFPLATFDAEFKSGKNEGCLHSCFCYDSVYFLCCCEKEKKIIDIKKKKKNSAHWLIWCSATRSQSRNLHSLASIS